MEVLPGGPVSRVEVGWSLESNSFVQGAYQSGRRCFVKKKGWRLGSTGRPILRADVVCV